MIKFNLYLLIVLQVLLLPASAVEPYGPEVELSVKEHWRWTELEALSGFGARCADEAEDGALWFARRDEVLRYDGRNLQSYALTGVTPGATVRDLHVSRAGEVYFLTDRYLSVLEDGVWRLLLEAETESLFLEAISETANGDIWLGLNDELVRVRDGEIERHQIDLENVGATVVDHHGRLWVAEARAGRVVIYDLDEDCLSSYREFEFDGQRGGLCRLLPDTAGRIWVIRPDSEDRCFLFENYEKKAGLNGFGASGLNTISVSLAETPLGRIWICEGRRLGEWTGEGIEIHSVEDLPLPTSHPFILGLSGNRLLIGGRASKTFVIDLSENRWMTYRNLNFQCEGNEGGYWFLHHDGRVVRRDSETEEWLAYDQSDGLIDSPNHISATSDGVVWLSGAHKQEAAISWFWNGVWQRRAFAEAGSIFSHLGVTEASDGAMLFGAGTPPSGLEAREGGAVIFRRDKERFKGSHVTPPIFPQRTANIVERPGDGFWFGAASMTRRLGNGTIEPERVELFEDNWIDHLTVDGDHNLWAALWGRGVYSYDGRTWVGLNESSGLASNQVVYLLAGEFLKGIWAATSEGLSRYDGVSWTNWELPSDVTFLREDNTLRESADGSLWLNYAYRSWLLEGNRNSAQGASFRTVRYRADQLSPETTLTDYGRGVPEGGQVAITWTGRDAWSTTKAEELQYSWKLDDGAWSRFSYKTSAVLDGLVGGEYLFEVRSRDTDWNIEPSPARAEFSVILPLWKRGWFIFMAVAAVVLIVYLGNALFRARVRTAFALEEFKLEFFTNISHELRNPLAVIVGPLESLLKRDTDTQQRGLLQVALRNARKMQGLVDQLLQFRKLELGKAHYRPSRGEIVGFIKDAVESDTPLWEAKNQEVKIIVDPMYLECEYDSDKLQKIGTSRFGVGKALLSI